MKKLFKERGPLLLLCAAVLCSFLLIGQTETRCEKEAAPLMTRAAQRTQQAFSAIGEARRDMGIPVDPIDDPNGTGLIGLSYSEITTTLGSLDAKRSTTNPNFSAMVVDLLMQCGVGPGDRVAVNFSGSFPAANISVLCALDAVGADGIVISSVGASTYGANIPEFTYQDMEAVLLEKGLIRNHSTAFSMGGTDDLGREMPDEVKQAIAARSCARGLTYLSYEDLDENITARRRIYEADGMPVCFVNVGGNLLSFGAGAEMLHARNGIISPDAGSRDGRGLIPDYHRAGIPVIHLLNMKNLLDSRGLPYDPVPIPPPGQGEVYLETRISRPLLAGLLILDCALFILAAVKIRKGRSSIPVWAFSRSVISGGDRKTEGESTSLPER